MIDVWGGKTSLEIRLVSHHQKKLLQRQAEPENDSAFQARPSFMLCTLIIELAEWCCDLGDGRQSLHHSHHNVTNALSEVQSSLLRDMIYLLCIFETS